MMTLESIRLRARALCAARIPALAAPQDMKQEELQAATRRGLLHRALIALDELAGVFGAWVPCTISARTAIRLRACQWTQPGAAGSSEIVWHPLTPTWALALGALLEIIDPGHLAGALRADMARSVLVLLQVTGATGISIHHQAVSSLVVSDPDLPPAIRDVAKAAGSSA